MVTERGWEPDHSTNIKNPHPPPKGTGTQGEGIGVEHKPASSVEERATLAALHALGVVDLHDDPVLNGLTNLAGRLARGRFHLWLRGTTPAVSSGLTVPVPLRPVTAGAEDETTEVSITLPVKVLDLVVGELRGHGVSRAASVHLAGEIEDLLARREAAARRDGAGNPVGVVVVDPELTVVWVSDEVSELGIGVGDESPVGQSALNLVHPDDLSAAAELIERAGRGTGRSTTVTMRLNTVSHEPQRFDIWSENRLSDASIGLMAMVARHTDAQSELTLLADQMFVLNRLSAGEPLGEVLHRVTDLIEHRDPHSCACIMEFDPIDGALHPLIAPRVPVPVIGALIGLQPGADAPAGGGAFHADAGIYCPDVTADPTYDRLAPTLVANGIRACWSIPIRSFNAAKLLGTIDVFRTVAGPPDTTESRVLLLASRLAAIAIDQDTRERELRHQANHDPLTGLPNRAMFSDRLAEAAEDGNVGVLFLDLDRFKLVNDTLGHEFGDEVLKAVAQRLEEAVDEPSLVSRFEGDEFTVLVPKVEGPSDLVRVGEQILAALVPAYTVRDHRVVLRASIGAALAIAPPPDPRSLIRDADTALYHAKERGRGRVEVFDEQMLASGAERVRIEGALREAIDNDGIVVHFQPTVRLTDGAVMGAEALARCEAPSAGPLPPVLFIPVAEEVGLIPAVFETVLTRSCEAAIAWNSGRREPLVVWVNLSPTQLGSAAVMEQIARIFATTGVNPAHIGFEVTETGILPDPEQAADFLGELRALGARIAIDDFGTGYSSLGYLQSLPVDVVKLDRSFVVRAGDDPRSRAIVGSVVELARAMSLSCVAEGVETTDQLDVVAELGCPVVQGYVFARPAPADEVTAWLATR